MPAPKRINSEFEGKTLATLTYQGRPCWIARDIGRVLDYSRDGRRLVAKIAGKWSYEFIEGHDYAVLRGDELAEFKASLGALFETDPGAEEVDPFGDDEETIGSPVETSPFDADDDLTTAPDQGEHAVVPVDESAPTDVGIPAVKGGTGSAWGSPASDPFAVQERQDADPFGAADTQDDPFGGDDAANTTADPFAITGLEHSHRVRQVDTQMQTKPDITPATFNLSDDPEALAASRKKPARLKIRYKRPQTFQREFRENLERGGTYIKTPKPLERGRRCAFELTVPGFDAPLQLRGVVVWSSAGGNAEGREPGMAIDYDTEDVQGLDAVRRAVEELG